MFRFQGTFICSFYILLLINYAQVDRPRKRTHLYHMPYFEILVKYSKLIVLEPDFKNKDFKII